MTAKSTTQMTKAELIEEINRLKSVIGELNQKIDELEGMAIQSDAIPLDADTSRLLSSMNARIKELEAQNKTKETELKGIKQQFDMQVQQGKDIKTAKLCLKAFNRINAMAGVHYDSPSYVYMRNGRSAL